MALVNKVDPVDGARGLEACLQAHFPHARDIRVKDLGGTLSSGFSTETVFFNLSWTIDGSSQHRPLVARVANGAGIFPDYDLAQEYRVMQAVANHSQVPVPELLLYEADPTHLGAPFLVMARAVGRSAADDPPYTVDGWLVDLPPEQQRQVHQNALAVMAEVHGIDWEAAGLASVGPPDAGRTLLESQFSYLERYADFASGGSPSPLIIAAIAALRDSQPAEPEPTVLRWGDARLANMLVAEDLSIAAAIDWEEASLGSPEMDLGYFLYIMRQYTEGIGVVAPPGFPTPTQVAAFYTELTGHTPRHLEFYERLAAVRGALIVTRVSNIMIDSGFLPPDSDMATNNPTTHLLARMFDLPAPAGVAGAWLAGR